MSKIPDDILNKDCKIICDGTTNGQCLEVTLEDITPATSKQQSLHHATTVSSGETVPESVSNADHSNENQM